MATIKTDTYTIDVKGANKSLDSLIDKNAKLATSTKKTGKSLLETASQISSVYRGVSQAFSSVMAMADKYVEASKRQQLADARLISIAKKVTGANKEQIQSMMDLADQMQLVTTFGDEVVQAGQSQLLSYGLQADQAETLTVSLLDLLAATKGIDASQEDAINSANMLGKAISGQVGALSRAGILMTDYQKNIVKTGTQTEKVAILTEILADNYGGLASSLAQTDIGGIKQVENAMSDLDEEIGEKLIPIVFKLKTTLLQTFRNTLPYIKTVISFVDKLTKDNSIKAYLDNTKEANETLFKSMSNNDIGSLLKEITDITSGSKLNLDFADDFDKLKELESILGRIAGEKLLESFKNIGQAGKNLVNGLAETLNKLKGADRETKLRVTTEESETKLSQVDTSGIEAEIKAREKLKEAVKTIGEDENTIFQQQQNAKKDILQEALNAGILSQEDYSLKLQAINEETNQAIMDNTLSSITESLEIISTLQSGISDIFSQIATNRMIEIDNEYKKKKANIEKNVKDEDAKAKALENLDKDYENKKREQQKKTAEMNKLTALFNIAIDTASAIVKVFPNPYLMTAAGILGATQAGLVASQPIPAFATGVVGMGGAGTATSDSNLAMLSRGESVVTAAGTNTGDNSLLLKNMNSGQSFSNATKDIKNLQNTIDGLSAIMANQDKNINVINEAGRDGITSLVQLGNSDFINENNRTQQESSI